MNDFEILLEEKSWIRPFLGMSRGTRHLYYDDSIIAATHKGLQRVDRNGSYDIVRNFDRDHGFPAYTFFRGQVWAISNAAALRMSPDLDKPEKVYPIKQSLAGYRYDIHTPRKTHPFEISRVGLTTSSSHIPCILTAGGPSRTYFFAILHIDDASQAAHWICHNSSSDLNQMTPASWPPYHPNRYSKGRMPYLLQGSIRHLLWPVLNGDRLYMTHVLGTGAPWTKERKKPAVQFGPITTDFDHQPINTDFAEGWLFSAINADWGLATRADYILGKIKRNTQKLVHIRSGYAAQLTFDPSLKGWTLVHIGQNRAWFGHMEGDQTRLLNSNKTLISNLTEIHDEANRIQLLDDPKLDWSAVLTPSTSTRKSENAKLFTSIRQLFGQ